MYSLEQTRMNKTNWEMTVPTNSKAMSTYTGGLNPGCLVHIYPLEIENNLVRLSNRVTTLGREPGSDIFCDDSSISRNHAQILRKKEVYVLEDQNSTNGTFVDGKRVSKTALTDGCQIQIGNHIFKFLASDSVESQYHETIYSMMTKDGLTNVYNKRYMVEVLCREFDRSKSYHRPFSVVLADIDYFKKFNDTYGHLAGDEVLQAFAHRIQSKCGPGQVFARYGGEEFALLLAETDKTTALQFSESLRRTISDEPFKCYAGPLTVTASFGVAQCCGDRHHAYADLLEEADRFLYQAKANGRNRVCGG
jgi:diguanylate cyclase (GGDEF)-like protein